MAELPLEELLRHADAHPAEPLSAARRAAAQRGALARFTAESAVATPRRRAAPLRWLEAAALPLAIGTVIYSAADWLGGLWNSAAGALHRSTARVQLEPGWLQELGAAMAEQPWLVALGAFAVAMLWLPPVRAALLGERD